MQDSIESHKEKRNDKTSFKTDGIYKETEELVAIIAKSIETAKKNKSSKS